MTGKELIEDAENYLIKNYAPLPVLLEKGRGSEVFDAEGGKYLDFVTGLSVNNLGHCCPDVVLAVQKQVQHLLHVSNLYHNKPQIELARLVVDNSFADRAFFCNSGAEANEAAIKLARKYSFDKFGTDRYEILTATNSFHGRTMATLTATGQAKVHAGFEPLLPGFKYMPFSDMDAVYKAVSKKTAAIMVEPIQGEGGVVVPGSTYLAELREFCTSEDILLIFDEIQTGMGRTGKLFAYEHYLVQPDIMTLAKGLGGGMPIGAMLATEQVAEAFTPGTHGSTFGGNPVSCAAGVAVCKLLINDTTLLSNVSDQSEYIFESLFTMKEKFDCISNLRGKGFMIGIEVTVGKGAQIVSDCINDGLLVNCTAGNIIRLLPPLNVTRQDVDLALQILEKVFMKIV